MVNLKKLLRGKGPVLLLLSIGIGLVLFLSDYRQANQVLMDRAEEELKSDDHGISRQEFARSLEVFLGRSEFFPEIPNPINLVSKKWDGDAKPVQLKLTLNRDLTEMAQGLMESHKPDFCSIVAVDAVTGEVLTLVSYSSRDHGLGNLALRATYPSASVFKVVTAAAAIEEKNFSSGTIISFNGSNHTFYKKNILNDRNTRWTRFMTLGEAFAKSVNTVFGKIAVQNIGAVGLRDYANRFAFDQDLDTDLPVEIGKASILHDPWKLAEAASGYTRDNTMSPLQGAMIAAAVANDGLMMSPFIVQSAESEGETIYNAKPTLFKKSIEPATAKVLRSLMKGTVTIGTGRKTFRKFLKRNADEDLEVGGKTGSLTGEFPKGKYDWFVGYGISPSTGRKIALGVVTINEKQWKVKSSYLAQRMIEEYFGL